MKVKQDSDLVTLRDIEAYVEFNKRDKIMDEKETAELIGLISNLPFEKQQGIV